MRVVAMPSLLLVAASCSYVQSSAQIIGRPFPPSTASVAISATRDPAGAEELGVVEAHGQPPSATIDALVIEFRTRVASMGGDYGRIDSFATKHEMVTETYQYECGTTETQLQTQMVPQVGPDGSMSFETVPVTTYVSKTCTGERTVETATLTLVGRAFRTSRGN